MKYKALITAIMFASVSLDASQKLEKTIGRLVKAASELKEALLTEELARISVRGTISSLIPLKKTLQKLEPLPDATKDEIGDLEFQIYCKKQDLRRELPMLLKAAKETKAILHEYQDVLSIVYNEEERNKEYQAAVKELK